MTGGWTKGTRLGGGCRRTRSCGQWQHKCGLAHQSPWLPQKPQEGAGCGHGQQCPIHCNRSPGTGDNVPNGCHQHLVATTIRNEDRLGRSSLGKTIGQPEDMPYREGRAQVLLDW